MPPSRPLPITSGLGPAHGRPAIPERKRLAGAGLGRSRHGDAVGLDASPPGRGRRRRRTPARPRRRSWPPHGVRGRPPGRRYVAASLPTISRSVPAGNMSSRKPSLAAGGDLVDDPAGRAGLRAGSRPRSCSRWGSRISCSTPAAISAGATDQPSPLFALRLREALGPRFSIPSRRGRGCKFAPPRSGRERGSRPTWSAPMRSGRSFAGTCAESGTEWTRASHALAIKRIAFMLFFHIH